MCGSRWSTSPAGRSGRPSISSPTIIRACPRRSRRRRRSSSQRPRSMIACGAGPVAGRTLKLTNAPWVMDGPETARRAGLAQGLLLNDFEAQALMLPAIPPGLVAPHRPARLRRPRPAGHSRAWNRPWRRRADRNRRPSHSSLVGRRSHRLRPGLARGVRALAASGARPAEGWTARA